MNHKIFSWKIVKTSYKPLCSKVCVKYYSCAEYVECPFWFAAFWKLVARSGAILPRSVCVLKFLPKFLLTRKFPIFSNFEFQAQLLKLLSQLVIARIFIISETSFLWFSIISIFKPWDIPYGKKQELKIVHTFYASITETWRKVL